MAHTLNWFEIPSANIERAVNFYSNIFNVEIPVTEAMSGFKMAMFPAVQGEVSGAIIHGEGYAPSTQGTLVYLNGGEDLSIVLNRVEEAGGQILTGKTNIGEHGFIAYFKDTEGNKVGLHSMD